MNETTQETQKIPQDVTGKPEDIVENPIETTSNESEDPVGDSLPIDNIEASEPKSMVDIAKFEGFRTKIQTVKRHWFTNWYTGKDGTYNPNSTDKTQKIVITTEPLPVMNENGTPTDKLIDLGDGKQLQVTARLSLSKKEEDGQTVWYISKHEKAKLWKFMRKLGVTELKDLVGKYVILTTEAARDESDDRLFLRIVI